MSVAGLFFFSPRRLLDFKNKISQQTAVHRKIDRIPYNEIKSKA